MFPRPLSPFRRARRPFRRILFGILVVLAFAFWQSRDVLRGWSDTHPHLIHDLSAQVDAGATNSQTEDRASHKRHMRWMRNLLSVPSRNTVPMWYSSPDDAGAGKLRNRHAAAGNLGPEDDQRGYSDTCIEHMINSPLPDSMVLQDSDPSTSPTVQQNPAAVRKIVLETPVDDVESAITDESDTRSRYIGDDVQLPLQALDTMNTWSERYRFPGLSECDDVKDRADTLPDMVVVPFDDAVIDMELMGWEDLWVSKARYLGPRLVEPRIDFVYNCK